MRPAEWLQEVRMKRFREAYGGWRERRLSQEEAARILEEGSAFVEGIIPHLDEILCEQHERSVGRDNGVSFDGKILQIPPDRHRCHYFKATVRVHRYLGNTLAVFHGPRKLARYGADGNLVREMVKASA